MRATVGPGIAIPPHRHADPEAFCLLEGRLKFLKHGDAASHWMTAAGADAVGTPGNVKHALRNTPAGRLRPLSRYAEHLQLFPRTVRPVDR
jgi:quercetin dioxygenase-like cupin family protein